MKTVRNFCLKLDLRINTTGDDAGDPGIVWVLMASVIISWMRALMTMERQTVPMTKKFSSL